MATGALRAQQDGKNPILRQPLRKGGFPRCCPKFELDVVGAADRLIQKTRQPFIHQTTVSMRKALEQAKRSAPSLLVHVFDRPLKQLARSRPSAVISRYSTSATNFGSTQVVLGALIGFVNFDLELTTVSSCFRIRLETVRDQPVPTLPT